MLGKIITSFIDMLQLEHDELFVDRVISSVPDCSGAYTDFEMYEDEEIHALVQAYSTISSKQVDSIWHEFGKHSFTALYEQHSHITQSYTDLLAVMLHLDSKIHPALNLMYDDIRFPSLTVLSSTDKEISLGYQSERNLVDFAAGLIEGCADYFEQHVTITKQTSHTTKQTSQNNYSAIFNVSLEAAA